MDLNEGVHSHLPSCIYRVGVAETGVGTGVEWSRSEVQLWEVREMNKSGGR